MLLPVDRRAELVREPPGLLLGLANLGVRLLDPPAHLVLEVPDAAVRHPEWARLAPQAAGYTRALYQLAGMIGSMHGDVPPERLLERIAALHADCAATVVEMLGGKAACPATLPAGAAGVDFACAVFGRGLAHQIIHDLDPRRGPRLGHLIGLKVAA